MHGGAPRVKLCVMEAAIPPVTALHGPRAPADGRIRRDVPLHSSVHRLWIWQALFGAAAIAGPAALVGLAKGWPLLLAAAGALMVALPAAAAAHGRRYARTFRCWLMTDGLLVSRGVWWRSEKFVPLARIQHTDVGQGPIARHYGIATLKVFTAGTVAGEVDVEGLGREDAIALRDQLLGRDGSDAV